MSLISEVLPEMAAASIQAVTRGGPRRQAKWNRRAAREQNEMNRANAEWMLEQNKRLLEEQRLYDSPSSQMARYKAAGLNPHLVYGSAGSSSSPIQVGGMPGANVQAPNASYPDIAGDFIAASQAETQISMNRARTKLTAAQEQLAIAKEQIERTNPMLNPLVYQAVTDSMWKGAQLKAAQDSYNLVGGYDPNDPNSVRIFEQKILAEIKLLHQRVGLNVQEKDLKAADIKIKNEVLESKQYLNGVNELIQKWVEDGDVSWEHFRRGIMLILNGMMR